MIDLEPISPKCIPSVGYSIDNSNIPFASSTTWQEMQEERTPMPLLSNSVAVELYNTG
jgi:hypothetical protein